MKTIIRLGIMSALTLVGVYVHGVETFRWGMPSVFSANDKIVANLPSTLGDWKLVSAAAPLTDSVKFELGVTEYASSVYSDGNDSVTLLLIAGETGRLVRHPPEICYSASGFQFLRKPSEVLVEVNAAEQHFRMIPMKRSVGDTSEFVVVYGFGHDGRFVSPASPRLYFHGVPSVLKVQVLCRSGDDGGKLPDAARRFISDLSNYIWKNDPQKL